MVDADMERMGEAFLKDSSVDVTGPPKVTAMDVYQRQSDTEDAIRELANNVEKVEKQVETTGHPIHLLPEDAELVRELFNRLEVIGAAMALVVTALYFIIPQWPVVIVTLGLGLAFLFDSALERWNRS